MHTRQINHIEHHKASSTKTLMRRSVSLPDSSSVPYLKAQHAFRYSDVAKLGPIRHEVVNSARAVRANKTQKSQYINHFIRPLGSSFTPTHVHPIKGVVHKPEIKADLSIDQLLMKAVDNAADQLFNLEQQPIRRLHRFSRALVANRFNGVTLD